MARLSHWPALRPFCGPRAISSATSSTILRYCRPPPRRAPCGPSHRPAVRASPRAARTAQIVVDVGRADGVSSAVLVEILEQVVTRQLGAAAHDALDTGVVDRHVVLDAALAAKPEAQLARFDFHVLLAQRRQSV